MVDMAAIAGAASALKSAYELSKAALSLHEAASIQAKVLEMQGQISSAMAGAITAQTDQMAMLKQVEALEKEVADLKAWGAEAKRYELKGLDTGATVYMLKPDERGGEPPHWLCTNCFTQGKKGFLQPTGARLGRNAMYKCAKCSSQSGCEHTPYWK